MFGVELKNLAGFIDQFPVAFLPRSLLAFYFQFSLVTQFQFSRHFHDDFAGVAVFRNQTVNHLSQLIQPDMDGGVGDSAVAFFRRVIRVTRTKANMALEWFTIIGQCVHDFACLLEMGQGAVTVETGVFYRLVVGDNRIVQLWQNARQRLPSQHAVSLGQTDIGESLRRFMVDAGITYQPVDEH